MNKRIVAIVGCTLGLALFFAVNMISRASLRSMRFDLTEDNLYTLSEGSKKIARKLDEPVRLYFYFSEKVAAKSPGLKNYGARVREMLEEFAGSSDGKIILEIIEPEPFSEEQDRAIEEGLYGMNLPNAIDPLYFGLVGTNSTDQREKIIFFEPGKERFLEYDVSRLIYSLSNTERRTVGILSSLPLAGSPGNPMMQQQPSPPWQIVPQIEKFFETKTLEPTIDEIPDDIDVLMVVHPRQFPPTLRYAIDQYVLAGGETIVFVDPHCEIDMTGINPNDPMSQFGASRNSELDDLFQAWGLEMVPNKIVGDRENGLAVRVQGPVTRAPQETTFVVYVGLDNEAMDQEDPVTSLLTNLIVGMGGAIRPTPNATTEFEPLVQTSKETMLIDVGMVQFRPDPTSLLTNFVSEKQVHTFAARISGKASTAFPDGRPGGEPEVPDEEGEEGAEDEPAEPTAHLAESVEGINVIVMADADLLADRFWIREEKLLGQISLGWRKTSDNGDFAMNAVENMAGGADLISIRARGKFHRPFEAKKELEKDAEQRFLSEQRALEQKLSEFERRINELQFEKTPDNRLILSPEQQAEVDRIMEEQTATKKKLREVKHNLRKDVERLGTKIKWLNILGMPGIVVLAALSLAGWRMNKRRS